jgi:hypothetical protein
MSISTFLIRLQYASADTDLVALPRVMTLGQGTMAWCRTLGQVARNGLRGSAIGTSRQPTLRLHPIT